MNNTKAVTRGMHVGCGCMHPEVTKIIDSTSEIEDKYFERVEKKRERERERDFRTRRLMWLFHAKEAV